MSEVVILFGKQNTYSVSKFKEWEPLTTGEFVDSPPLVPWTCALSALILSLSLIHKGINVEILTNSIYK